MRKRKHLVALVVVAAVILAVGAVTAYAQLATDTTPPTTSADVAATYWGPATITINATDNESVAYIYYRLLQAGTPAPDQPYIHLYRASSNTGQAQTTITVPAPASGSATYTLQYWAQDATGNVETPPNAATFTIKTDTIAPTAVASGVTANAWYNHSVTVTVTATDNPGGSGVASIATELNGGSPVVTDGSTATVVIPVDATTHANDGANTVKFWATDVAGNVEAAQTITVNIDTRAPAPQAPYSATATRGRTATLKYEVADASPNSGTAAVVIKVKNSAGKVVKTLNFASKPVNTLLAAKFTIPSTWRIGTYRFFVYATDGAGNVQLKAAVNKLIVK